MGGEGDHCPVSNSWRLRSDSEICAEALRHQEEQRRIALLRPDMTPVEAQRALQRRGYIVYRASVAGGRADRWFCSGVGKDVTDAQLVAKAEQLQADRIAA